MTDSMGGNWRWSDTVCLLHDVCLPWGTVKEMCLHLVTVDDLQIAIKDGQNDFQLSV